LPLADRPFESNIQALRVHSLFPIAGIYLVAKQIEAGRKDDIADSQDSKDEDQATSIALPGQQQSPNSDTHVEGPSSLQLVLLLLLVFNILCACTSYYYYYYYYADEGEIGCDRGPVERSCEATAKDSHQQQFCCREES